MKTITAQIEVPETGTITLPVPTGLQPGVHAVLVVIEEDVESPLRVKSFDDFPVDSVGTWHGDKSLRRENLYGDDGR